MNFIRKVFRNALSLAPHLKTGVEGEDLAAKFLEKRGLKIIERNYRKKWGEIDIVARGTDGLHFVEVKSVSRENDDNDDFMPEYRVNASKKRRLRRIVETYLLEKKCSEEFQVDIVSVHLGGRLGPEFGLIEDIKL